MKWTNSEDIGIALFEKFPAVDPLTVRFTDLRERVMGLDGFDDDAKASNEPKLEAIQMSSEFVHFMAGLRRDPCLDRLALRTCRVESRRPPARSSSYTSGTRLRRRP